MAVSIPGAAGKGKVVDSLVSQVDILPTILDYLGIPIHEQCEGKSLRGLIEGKVETVNEFIFIEYTGEAVADGYAVR
ncbi:MAG: sulfatase/phosphatase domain-containing protein, partial [Planctomycetota bacterium]